MITTHGHSPFSARMQARFRSENLGVWNRAGDDYDLWNNAHTATLEDYNLEELDPNRNRNLFHHDAWPFLPR